MFPKKRRILRRKGIEASVLNNLRNLIVVTKRKNKKPTAGSGSKKKSRFVQCSCPILEEITKIPTKKSNRLTFVAMGYKYSRQFRVTALIKVGKSKTEKQVSGEQLSYVVFRLNLK